MKGQYRQFGPRNVYGPAREVAGCLQGYMYRGQAVSADNCERTGKESHEPIGSARVCLRPYGHSGRCRYKLFNIGLRLAEEAPQP